MFCQTCGIVDQEYDENEHVIHLGSIKHICNQILLEYKSCKKLLSKNREGIFIKGGVEKFNDDGQSLGETGMVDHHKIRIYIKPKTQIKFIVDIFNECMEDIKPKTQIKFIFDIFNECKEDLLIVGIQLAHPQPQFVINEHPYVFGEDPHVWEKKKPLPHDISVSFSPSDIGQYEMPIMFTFQKLSNEEANKKQKPIIFVREMVVNVEENPVVHPYPKSPYTKNDLDFAKHRISSTGDAHPQKFRVPHLLKILLPRGLEEKALEGINQPIEVINQLRKVLIAVRVIFDEGITRENYMHFFHHLLWWEEVVTRINLRKYNMSGVNLELGDGYYVLEVPGLAEKRPSLLRGDRVYLQPKDDPSFLFESVIKNIEDNYIHLGEIDVRFHAHFSPDAQFDVRFIMSRVPMERCHEAVSWVFSSKQDARLFPEPRRGVVPVKTITKFFNPLIKDNVEQRSAVQHIVAGTSGKAPYIVFGPPGTGKTMTIVEAIIQLVVRNPRNRVLVCTDSNMAADHIAVMLLHFNKQLNINSFLLRANSQSREWTIMPPVLAPHSNGTSYKTFISLRNDYVASFRIVVTTLLHAAKYASPRCQQIHRLKMSHLFIDEAAQAAEPHTLVPITGLLASTGQLILAGDPKQLGPVCISKEASNRGLGTSLLERLLLTCDNLYENDPNYMTMLVNNFRSDPDILRLPNELFYDNGLIALAPKDPLSQTSILGLPGGQSAIVFHAVHSREQRLGSAPSYFNEKELEMLRRYVKALTDEHKVLPEDIGIIAPYIRQVYKMKAWLVSQNYEKIEVGTVEAFQGKEKRVILVSTVRANCRLLEYDAKYALGFLVDDKRFNVTITRAKAKVVIVGNPACLTRDFKWRKYMELCNEGTSYYGQENQQMERTTELLTEIARTRFEKCGLKTVLDDKKKEKEMEINNNKKNNKKKNKKNFQNYY